MMKTYPGSSLKFSHYKKNHFVKTSVQNIAYLQLMVKRHKNLAVFIFKKYFIFPNIVNLTSFEKSIKIVQQNKLIKMHNFILKHMSCSIQ